MANEFLDITGLSHFKDKIDQSHEATLNTALANKVGSETIDSIVELTQAEYDALTTKDPGVIYIVTDPDGVEGDPVGILSVEQTTTSTESDGVNVVTVTKTDGTTSTFQVKNGSQGLQGNSGYTGAADELEVVNNLTDGGARAALSAEQGVVLRGEINQLQQEVDELLPTITEEGFALADYAQNVVVKYDSDGLDVAKFSEHFINALLLSGGGGPAATNFARVTETGFFIVDEQLNVGMSLSNDGLVAKNIFKAEIVEQ